VTARHQSRGAEENREWEIPVFRKTLFLETRETDDLFGVWKWLEEWRGGRLDWDSVGAREVMCEDIFQG